MKIFVILFSWFFISCAPMGFTFINVNHETRSIAVVQSKSVIAVTEPKQFAGLNIDDLSVNIRKGGNGRSFEKIATHAKLKKYSLNPEFFRWRVDISPTSWSPGIYEFEFYRAGKSIYKVEVDIQREFVSPYDY